MGNVGWLVVIVDYGGYGRGGSCSMAIVEMFGGGGYHSRVKVGVVGFVDYGGYGRGLLVILGYS